MNDSLYRNHFSDPTANLSREEIEEIREKEREEASHRTCACCGVTKDNDEYKSEDDEYCGQCVDENAADKLEKAKEFEEIKVCPHCGEPSEERFERSVCSDGCGCIEGYPTVYKFSCPDCGDLCDEEKCNCIKL